MIELTSTELFLHGVLFFCSILTVILIFISYLKFSFGELKRVLFFYVMAFTFSAMRWVGGSLARIRFGFTEYLWYNIIWTISGVLAAAFGIYASILLLKFSKTYGFKG